MEIILIGLVVLTARIVQDFLFLKKIDSFNRNDKVRSMIYNFIEAMYTITVLKIIIELIDQSYIYVVLFGLGSMIGGLIISKLKARMDNKLEGQRKFYARISIDEGLDPNPLLIELKERDFDFTVDHKSYINGKRRTVIQGSLENRKRMEELKEILRGKKGKHVTIFRAEDVYAVY